MDLNWLKDPVGSALRGEHPTVLCRMRSGFAVIGVNQFLPGYCLLLACPKADRLEALERKARTIFLDDMALLGEAVAKVCEPRRVNYSIYGNTDPYLHAHVFPRYAWEPPERLTRPVWEYSPAHWNDRASMFSEEKHGDLRRRLAGVLAEIASAQ